MDTGTGGTVSVCGMSDRELLAHAARQESLTVLEVELMLRLEALLEFSGGFEGGDELWV
jgi:hypothetical protein